MKCPYDRSGYRWLQWDRNGVARVTLRDAAGQATASFEVDSVGAKLETEYLYGAGQLLVERLPATAPPTAGGIGGPPGSPVQKISVRMNQVPFDGSLTYFISADDGSSSSSSGLHTDSSGTIEVPVTAFVPGMTNHLRVKPDDDPAALYSAPVSVLVDGTVTPSSSNQIRVLTVSRSGSNVQLNWTLLQANGKKTLLYFRRADTGTVTQVTPQALQAGVNSYVLPSQALASPEGTFFGKQVNADQTLTPGSPGTGLPPAAPGLDGEPSVPTMANRYQHRDHLGSLRVVTDAAGVVARDGGGVEERHDYYPFGGEMVPAGHLLATGSRRKFTGHERDEASGLDYMLARYHAPALGRFLSVDPVLDLARTRPSPQMWNRFGYVANRPVHITDPDGKVMELDSDEQKRTAQVALIQESLGKAGSSVRAVQQKDGSWVLGTAKGVSLNQLSKMGVAAHGMAHVMASASAFKLSLGRSTQATKGGGAAFEGDGRGGGTFFVNPASFPKQTADVTQTAATAFLHELGHGLGEVFQGVKFKGGELHGLFAWRENNAMAFENAFRREQQIELRTQYTPFGSVFVFDSQVPPEQVIP